MNIPDHNTDNPDHDMKRQNSTENGKAKSSAAPTPVTFESPLSHPAFYVLLAMVRGDRHGYGFIVNALGASQGIVRLKPGTIYPLLKRLTNAGHIESTGYKATPTRTEPRLHYALTKLGVITLKEELRRMRQAVEIGENNGLLADDIPLDIQRILDKVR